MQRTLNAIRLRRAAVAVPLAAAVAVLLLALLAAPSLAIEGPAFDGKTHHGPGAHALTNARIVQAPGRVIENGTLVVRDGIIVAVGADIEAPADARVWDLEGATLYPGLIETHATFDVPKPGEGDDEPAGLHPNPLVRPERDAADFSSSESTVKKLRGGGAGA